MCQFAYTKLSSMYVYLIIFVSFLLYKMTKNSIEDANETSDSSKWCNWSKYSPTLLRSVEKEILAYLKSPYNGRYINIGPIVGKDDRIWTLSMNEMSKNTPIVLLHGMGSGVALWVMNLDKLAANRPVHAIDVLGFGSSSRPTFSSDPKIVEMQMVAALEEWRRVMKLEKFVLVGHSLGGFISISYAMQYPSRIKHLVLADAWGISESPEDISSHYNLPVWARAVAAALRPLNPLWAIRAAGPWGAGLVGKARKDIVAKFAGTLPNAEDLIPKYIHQCNCQKPTGESGFHVMMHYFAFAKNPIIRRMHRLDKSVPLTMLFGSRSWVDRTVGPAIKEDRADSYVNVKIIEGAGHHLNLDQPSDFNQHVVDICRYEDSKVAQCACSEKKACNGIAEVAAM